MDAYFLIHQLHIPYLLSQNTIILHPKNFFMDYRLQFILIKYLVTKVDRINFLFNQSTGFM